MESAHVVPSRSARVRVGLGAAVVLVLVAFGVAVLVSILGASRATESIPLRDGDAAAASDPDAGSETDAGMSAEGPPGSSGPPGPSASGPDVARMFVHILGAVERPGLYELGVGSRAIDAVAAAGGLTADADQGGLNLARLLVDGEQIVVPIMGATPPVSSGGIAGGTGPGGATAGGPVDLNTADSALLDTLPGVGPATAQRILDWRESNGRFTSVEDLLSVSGIGEKTFAELKDLVTV